MTLNMITVLLNEMLAGERHSYAQLKLHLDRTIDDINADLGSCYPAFSEMDPLKAEYDYFPDRYIRTVVLPGAAWYYFTTDEEGISTASQYALDYERGKFLMLRDHFNSVPAEYQVTDLKALVSYKDIETGERGVTVDAISLLP